MSDTWILEVGDEIACELLSDEPLDWPLDNAMQDLFQDEFGVPPGAITEDDGLFEIVAVPNDICGGEYYFPKLKL